MNRQKNPPQSGAGDREYGSPGDKRPKSQDVSKQHHPMTPEDATGINAKDRRPIDPRMIYLPPA